MPLDDPLVLAPPVLVPAPLVLPEVLEPDAVPPALDEGRPSSFRHFSFSAPVSVSQRAEAVVALLLVEGEVLGVAEGVDEELEPADGLELEPLEVCPNDAADIANSAAAVAVTRIFNVMSFSCVRVEKR
jgi:hypothetical protein